MPYLKQNLRFLSAFSVDFYDGTGYADFSRISVHEEGGFMKKIINDPVLFVQDTLAGVYYTHADEVTFTDGSRKAMIRKTRKPGKVALVTGGGSGHLPLFLV